MTTNSLKIDTIPLGPLATNAYLISDSAGQRGFVIDPGINPASLLKRIESMLIEAIILTHAHFDHIAGVDEIRRAKHCPVYLHDAEADWLAEPKWNGSLHWSEVCDPVSIEPATYALDEGMKLQLLNHTFHIYHTPGHSPGSVSLYWPAGNAVFSGDVLFRQSVGRTDLRGGNSQALERSIREKLFALPGETDVYPGHGPRTTIQYEQTNNPYV